MLCHLYVEYNTHWLGNLVTISGRISAGDDDSVRDLQQLGL